jgi:hypothetical protein
MIQKIIEATGGKVTFKDFIKWMMTPP